MWKTSEKSVNKQEMIKQGRQKKSKLEVWRIKNKCRKSQSIQNLILEQEKSPF